MMIAAFIAVAGALVRMAGEGTMPVMSALGAFARGASAALFFVIVRTIARMQNDNHATRAFSDEQAEPSILAGITG